MSSAEVLFPSFHSAPRAPPVSTDPALPMSSGTPAPAKIRPLRLSPTAIQGIGNRPLKDVGLVNFEVFNQLLSNRARLPACSRTNADLVQDRAADSWQLTKALCCEKVLPPPPRGDYRSAQGTSSALSRKPRTSLSCSRNAKTFPTSANSRASSFARSAPRSHSLEPANDENAARTHALGLTSVTSSLVALDSYIASCYSMTTALEPFKAPSAEEAKKKKSKEPTREELEEDMVEDMAKVEELVSTFGRRGRGRSSGCSRLMARSRVESSLCRRRTMGSCLRTRIDLASSALRSRVESRARQEDFVEQSDARLHQRHHPQQDSRTAPLVAEFSYTTPGTSLVLPRPRPPPPPARLCLDPAST